MARRWIQGHREVINCIGRVPVVERVDSSERRARGDEETKKSRSLLSLSLARRVRTDLNSADSLMYYEIVGSETTSRIVALPS